MYANTCDQTLNRLGHAQTINNEICIKVCKCNKLCERYSGGPTFIDGKLVGVTNRRYSKVEGNRYQKCGGKKLTVLTNVKTFCNWIRRQVR